MAPARENALVQASRLERLRPPLADAVLAVVLSLLVFFPPLLLTAPLAWRRRFPLAAFAVQVVGIAVGADRFRPEPTAFVAFLVGVYSLGAYCRSALVSFGVLLAFAAAVAVVYDEVVPPIPGVLVPFVLVLPIWLAGNRIALSRSRAEASTSRAQRAERERDEAIAQERARIARELHDVVSHNVSVMVVQASAGRQVIDAEPAFAREALGAIERVGLEAMRELRDMLGVLAGDATPGGPAGLAQLEALAGRMREAGVPVVVERAGTARPLPAAVDLAAYRVVQEALTNALRHAPGAAARVRVEHRPGELLVEVVNGPAAEPPAGPPQPELRQEGGSGAGRGLIGLAERLRMLDGELAHGPRLVGGFRVATRIPVEEEP